MEYFSTGNVLGIEQRLLPASTYNVMRTLFHQCGKSCIFVPIRSMQYQAIIDDNEVSFVYIHRRSAIEFSWRSFKPQIRESLEDPVAYEFVYYDLQAIETMQRIQVEFHKFAHQLNHRAHERQQNTQKNGATVSRFRPRNSKD